MSDLDEATEMDRYSFAKYISNPCQKQRFVRQIPYGAGGVQDKNAGYRSK
jgi:hypothetical protein